MQSTNTTWPKRKSSEEVRSRSRSRTPNRTSRSRIRKPKKKKRHESLDELGLDFCERMRILRNNEYNSSSSSSKSSHYSSRSRSSSRSYKSNKSRSPNRSRSSRSFSSRSSRSKSSYSSIKTYSVSSRSRSNSPKPKKDILSKIEANSCLIKSIEDFGNLYRNKYDLYDFDDKIEKINEPSCETVDSDSSLKIISARKSSTSSSSSICSIDIFSGSINKSKNKNSELNKWVQINSNQETACGKRSRSSSSCSIDIFSRPVKSREKSSESLERIRQKALESLGKSRDKSSESLEKMREKALESIGKNREKLSKRFEKSRENPTESLEKIGEKALESYEKSPRINSQHFESAGFGKFIFDKEENRIKIISENGQEIKISTPSRGRSRWESPEKEDYKIPSAKSSPWHLELEATPDSLMRFIMDSKRGLRKSSNSSKSHSSASVELENLQENHKKIKEAEKSSGFLKTRHKFLKPKNSDSESSRSYSSRSNSGKSQSSRSQSKRSRNSRSLSSRNSNLSKSNRFYDIKDRDFYNQNSPTPYFKKITSAIYLSQFIINKRKYFSRYRSWVYQKNLLAGRQPFGRREPSPTTSECSSSSRSSDLIFSYRKIYQESISSRSSYRVRSPGSRNSSRSRNISLNSRKSSNSESENSSVKSSRKSRKSAKSRKFRSRSKSSTSRSRSRSRHLSLSPEKSLEMKNGKIYRISRNSTKNFKSESSNRSSSSSSVRENSRKSTFSKEISPRKSIPSKETSENLRDINQSNLHENDPQSPKSQKSARSCEIDAIIDKSVIEISEGNSDENLQEELNEKTITSQKSSRRSSPECQIDLYQKNLEKSYDLSEDLDENLESEHITTSCQRSKISRNKRQLKSKLANIEKALKKHKIQTGKENLQGKSKFSKDNSPNSPESQIENGRDFEKQSDQENLQLQPSMIECQIEENMEIREDIQDEENLQVKEQSKFSKENNSDQIIAELMDEMTTKCQKLVYKNQDQVQDIEINIENSQNFMPNEDIDTRNDETAKNTENIKESEVDEILSETPAKISTQTFTHFFECSICSDDQNGVQNLNFMFSLCDHLLCTGCSSKEGEVNLKQLKIALCLICRKSVAKK